MAPSPTKYKWLKSSGKIFRKKDQESHKSSTSSSHGSNGNGNGGKKEDNGHSSSGSASSSLDLKDCPLMLPILSPIDHNRYLPRYSNLLEMGLNNKILPVCNGDNLSMEELDNLQLELELLASSCLVMRNSIASEISIIEQLEKGKVIPRAAHVSPGKRFRQDPERPHKKAKDASGKARDISHVLPPPSSSIHSSVPSSNSPKVKCSIIKNEPLFDVPDLPSTEAPRPPPPRNDIINRFWGMVEQYCQEINAEDIKLLEEMISARNNDDPDIYKIQPLGKHYTLRWAQEDLLDEQKEGSKIGDGSTTSGKRKLDNPDKLLRELDMNHHVNGSNGSTSDDTPTMGPIAQRLLAALVDERPLLQNDSNAENKASVGVSRPGMLRSLGLGSGAGLEKRLKKELQEQGIMEPDHPGNEDDDEVLSELKKAQSELRVVAAHNQQQLTRLLKQARGALVRHDLKKKLKDAEAKVNETHKNFSSMRVKKKAPSKKEKDIAWKYLKDREAIVKQLDSQSVGGQSSTL